MDNKIYHPFNFFLPVAPC